jgi:hypothetical protein
MSKNRLPRNWRAGAACCREGRETNLRCAESPEGCVEPGAECGALSDGRLYRMAGAAHGRGQLDAGTGRYGRRGECSREKRPSFAVDDLGLPFRLGSDVIIAMPCGFDLDRAANEMYWLTQNPRWPQLRAVQNGRTYDLDGYQYFNRPGLRLAQTLEILAEILHPDRFSGKMHGAAWLNGSTIGDARP